MKLNLWDILWLFGLAVYIISCGSSNSTEQKDVREFEVEVKIQSVIFYSDTLNFDEPLIVSLKPNTNKITLIDLGNGNPFGVKYFVSERITGNESELVHNASFFENVLGEWKSINPIEHRDHVRWKKKNTGVSELETKMELILKWISHIT